MNSELNKIKNEYFRQRKNCFSAKKLFDLYRYIYLKQIKAKLEPNTFLYTYCITQNDFESVLGSLSS
jgi:hypothetical protein